MGEFTLSADERLKSRKSIATLFEKGASLYKHPLKLVYATGSEEDTPVSFACSVSKKKFKRAVDRNRIKRLIREAFRLEAAPLRETCAAKRKKINLIFIFTGNEMPEYQLVHSSLKKLLDQLIERV